MNNPQQPRRYVIRAMHDVEKLTQEQIAEKLGISQATVQRDLAETVPPAGYTGGVPFYPPGRFDRDPEYVTRVKQLAVEMPELLARRQAATEFSGGSTLKPARRPSTEKHVAAMEAFAKARSG